MSNNLETRGISGLVNIGNTCYMNSALQCLSASNIFSGYLIKKKFVSDLKDNIVETLANIERKKRKDAGKSVDDDDDISVYLKDVKHNYYNSMTYSLYKLFKTMWKCNSKVTPRTFKQNLGNHCSMFKGYQQQDSQEFIGYILDKIHEEIKCEVSLKYRNIPTKIVEYIKFRKEYLNQLKDIKDPNLLEEQTQIFKEYKKEHEEEEIILQSLDYWNNFIKKNYSPVIDMFSGLFMGEIICDKCKNRNVSFEPFNILPLAISSETNTLNDCLKEFTKPDLLTGDNKYKCDTCKEHCDATKRMFIWDLPEMLIIQFKRFSNLGRRTSKNDKVIKFPLENLTFEDTYHQYRVRDYVYNLYGIVYHMGGLGGGHYISYTKNPLNNKWYRYNDETVHHIPDDDIEKEIQTSGSYILFYKKVYKASENSGDNDFGEDNSDDGFTSEEDVK